MKNFLYRMLYSKWAEYSLLLLLLLLFALQSCSGGGSIGAPVVAQPPITSGTAVVSWNPVVTYTDGSVLMPAGYRVYQGTTSRVYTQTYSAQVSSSPTYTVTALLTGHTYYFAVTVLDSSGAESVLSAEVHKVI